MRYLTSEHWKQFERGTPKGIAFENLVQRLLPKLIPGRWIRTQPSWDRARDFWRRHDSKTIAAECKFYRDPISLKVLSNTLVMAIVDDLARILFFSHSRLNHNTLSHLAAYSEQTGKKIEVYDDEKLESLILDTPAALRLFPRFRKHRAYTFDRALILTEHVSRDPDVEYLDIAADDAADETRSVSAELYETVALDIFLTNNTLEAIEGTITVDESTANGATLLLDRDVRRARFRIPFKIPRAGLFSRRLYFKIMKPGATVPLPKYSILTSGLVLRDLRVRKPLEVPALLRPPLIGRLYNAIQRNVRRLVSARDTAISVALHGASGTGKSRLLDELRDDFVAVGYTVYRFRGENTGVTTFDEVLRKYVAKRYRLPLSPATEEQGRQSPRRALGSPLVHRILYDANYQPSNHFAECRELVFSSLQDTKTAFFIDDLQSFDDTTVTFLNELVSRGDGTGSRTALVFTVNTDLTAKGSSCMRLLERLDGLRRGAGRDAARVMVESIAGFSKPDAKSYLDHCFAVPGTPPSQRFTVRYPETADLFLEHVPLNPLFIEQFLRFLLQADIIGRDGDALEVLDPGAFNDTLRHAVPHDLSVLLDRRWNFVRGKVGAAGQGFIDLLALFVYLPLSVAVRWRVPQSLLYRLRDYGFVRMDDRNMVVFYHQLFFRYFKQVEPAHDRAWARRVLGRFDRTLQKEYPAQYLLVLERTRPLESADVRYAIETVERDAAALEYLTEFSNALLRATSECDGRDRGRLLNALRMTGQRVKSRTGFGRAFDILRRTGQSELSRPELYRRHGDAFMRLALSCANIHVTVREDYGAAAILQDALSRFDDFRFKEPRGRSEILCAILDRLCVAMRSLSQREEALHVGRQAEVEAIAARLPHMRMQAHIDMGYVYYGRLVDREDLLKQWSTALSIMPAEKIPPAPVTGPNVWRYHNVHVLALRGKFDEAADAVAAATARATRELDTFHLVKLLAMEVVVALMRERQVDYADLELTTDRIVDLCIRHDARQTYWVGLHARAKVAERRRDSVVMGTATSAAFRQLMAFAGKHPEMQERYHEPMLDLAIMARKARIDLPPEQVAQITTIGVRSEIETVLRSTDAAFRAYRRHFRPLSTYHDGRFDLPCP